MNAVNKSGRQQVSTHRHFQSAHDLVSLWAWTEEAPTCPNHCGTLLHRDLEVCGHPHRTLDKAELIDQSTEKGETSASILWFAHRADSHQSDHVESQSLQPLHQFGGRRGPAPSSVLIA